MSSINFSAFRTLSPDLSSSLIAKPTRSLFFDSCVGYLSKAEFVSSLPPLLTKPCILTPRNTLLHSLIHYHQPVRSLRSSDQHYLLPTQCTTNFGSRSFRCSAPAIWNSIPLDIRSLLLPSCLGHLLPVHQIQFILTLLHVNIVFTFTLHLRSMALIYAMTSLLNNNKMLMTCCH